jgi:hypothetical protein
MGIYAKDKVRRRPFFSILIFCLRKKKIPLPFALFPLISAQRIMRDRNPHQHSKVQYRPPSNSSECAAIYHRTSARLIRPLIQLVV